MKTKETKYFVRKEKPSRKDSFSYNLTKKIAERTRNAFKNGYFLKDIKFITPKGKRNITKVRLIFIRF